MPTINIKVKDKIAKQTGNERYVCGNSDFTVEFEFDSEWDAFPTKTARFRYDGVYQEKVFTGNSCPVPVIFNAGAIAVGVYAGDLRTTTAAIVEARHSILDGDHVQYVPPDLYEELTGQYAQLAAELEEVRKRLEALENGEGGGGTPDEPDVPVVTKLAAPSIRIETVSDGAVKLAAPRIRLVTDDDGGTEDDGTLTPAILGVAILGRTILGKTDIEGTAEKLASPSIRLETVSNNAVKLAAPSIRLETVEDGDDGGEDEPTITQLSAPVITLETVTDKDEEPVAQQLSAPVIELETVVLVLDAPEIELVEV